MNLAETLVELRNRGIVVSVVPDDPDALDVAGPRGALTSELVERLRTYKPDLLAHLRTTGRDGRWRAADWPEGSIDPDSIGQCSTCGSFDRWQSLAETWRCNLCDPPSAAAVRVVAAMQRYRPWR